MNVKKSSSIKISIIIAVYNAADSLAKTLESLNFQSYRDFEVIIVDNNSNDNTALVVSRYSRFISHYIKEEDSGIYDAWNKGLQFSSGGWISFLGAGDRLYQDSLLKMLKLIETQPNINFVSGCIDLVDNNGGVKKIGSIFCPDKIMYFQNVVHIASLTSKSLIVENGCFNSNYKISGDYDFFLRVRNFVISAHLDEAISTGNMGVSQTNPSVIYENYLIWESLGVHNSITRRLLFLKRIAVFYFKIINENISRRFLHK